MELDDQADGFGDRIGTYGVLENIKKGLVSLNACTTAMPAAKADIERRMVVAVLG